MKTILTTQLSEPINAVTMSPPVITSLHGTDNAVKLYYQGIFIGQWDGTNAAGDPATNGQYHIKIDNIDPLGAVTTTTEQVMVSRAIYKSTIIIYNEVGEIVRHLYAFADDPGQPAILSVQLSTSVIKPGYNSTNGTPNQVSISMNNGTTLVWDGKGDSGAYVQQGQYLMEVHTVDGAGGQTTVTEQLSVQAADLSGLGGVIAKPNVIDFSKGITGTTLAVNGNVTLHVGIYTMAGELARTAEGPAGTGQVTWDASGLASGLYLAVVDLMDGQGRTLDQKVLKILVRH